MLALSVMSSVIVCCMPWHAFVIAKPATGASARVRTTKTANNVRTRFMTMSSDVSLNWLQSLGWVTTHSCFCCAAKGTMRRHPLEAAKPAAAKPLRASDPKVLGAGKRCTIACTRLRLAPFIRAQRSPNETKPNRPAPESPFATSKTSTTAESRATPIPTMRRIDIFSLLLSAGGIWGEQPLLAELNPDEHPDRGQ